MTSVDSSATPAAVPFMWTQRISARMVIIILSLTASLLGMWRYRNLNSVANVTANVVVLVFIILDQQAVRRNNLRTRTVIAWLSMVGVGLLVLILPELSALGLLAVIDGLLRSLAPERSSRRIMLISSILTLAISALIIVYAEAASIGFFHSGNIPFIRFEADLRHLLGQFINVDPNTPSITTTFVQAIFSLYFAIVIVNWLRIYYQRYTTTITQISSTNDEFAAAQRLLQQSVLERTKLLEISRIVTMPQETTLLLQTLLESLQEIIDFDRASICLVQNEKIEDLLSIGTDSGCEELRAIILANPSYLQVVLDMRQPVVIADLREIASTEKGALLGVPLVVRGRYMGFLALRHMQPDHYDTHAVDVCMAFANQVAGAIDAVQLQSAATAALVSAERSRLARELHDSVSQSLYGIVLGTRTALRQISQAPTSARPALEYSSSLANTALAQIRALIFTLRPEKLDSSGLISALRAQIELLRTHCTAQMQFDASSEEPAIPALQKEMLYHIALEAMQNAVRHAQCSSIIVRLHCDTTHLTLEVVDDGCGFDVPAEDVRRSGLRAMNEHAAAIQAAFTLTSTPGAGTRVRVSVLLGAA